MNLSTKVLLGAGLVSLIGWVLTGAYDALPVFLNVMQEINQLARLGVNSNTTNFTLIAAGMGLFYYLSPLSVAWMMRGAYKGKATTRTKRGAAIIPPLMAVGVPWSQAVAVQSGVSQDFGGLGNIDYSLGHLVDFTDPGFLLMCAASLAIALQIFGFFGSDADESSPET